jgi:hypothetical protein
MPDPVTDFTINVNYDPHAADGKPFKYRDENNDLADAKAHCLGGKTIQWHLNTTVHGVKLLVTFPKDYPFVETSTGPVLADTLYTFNTTHKMGCYKYSALIVKTADETIVVDSNDPHIIFDDGTSGSRPMRGINDPKHDIEVTVTAPGNINITVKVIGPN